MLTSLKAILRGAARSLGVERAANAALIKEMWRDVVGPLAACHSRVVGIRGTVVLAETGPGPWIQELSARRWGYVAEINRRLGGEVVTDVRFKPVPSLAALSGGTGPEDEAGRHAAGEFEDGNASGGEPPLSVDETTAVERAVAEIHDPEIRDGARRAMMSQMRWRRRQGTDTEKR